MMKKRLVLWGMLIGFAALGMCGCAEQSEDGFVEPQTIYSEASDEASKEDAEDASKQEMSEDASTQEASEEEIPEEGTSAGNMTESSAEPTEEAIPSEETPEPPTLSLVMVGDMLLHMPVERSAQQEDGSYDFRALFANVKEDIEAADVAIVNQEVILGGKELGISGYPAFNAPFEVADALADTGFDVVCHGTNHALDKHETGLLNCINYWKNNYPEMAVLGIHDSQESQDTIYIYEKDEFKIAILDYTYGTNGVPLPDGMPYAVDYLQEKKVVADLKKAEELADFTVVCVHWGTEYQLEYSAKQEKWASVFAANGADLVLGTHPHVIQPVEWYVDETTGHEMLVYYSLGNFVNWTSTEGEEIAKRMVGGMAQVELTARDGQVVISEYGIEPVVCHVEKGVNGVTVYKLSDYTVELAERNAIRKTATSFSLEYCRQLCSQVFGELYQMEKCTGDEEKDIT